MWQRQRGVRADEVRKKCVAGVGVVGLAAGPFSVTNFQAIFQGRILKKVAFLGTRSTMQSLEGRANFVVGSANEVIRGQAAEQLATVGRKAWKKNSSTVVAGTLARAARPRSGCCPRANGDEEWWAAVPLRWILGGSDGSAEKCRAEWGPSRNATATPLGCCSRCSALQWG